MRDQFSEPDGSRKSLHGERRLPMSLAQRQAYATLIPRFGRGGRRNGESGAGVAADPRKPNTLSGGAAAALEFD